MKTSEIKRKPVIRKTDGSIVGKIVDFEVNPSTFQIEAVCLQEKQTLLQSIIYLFVNRRIIVINVNKIAQIGKDIIFADLVSSEKR